MEESVSIVKTAEFLVIGSRFKPRWKSAEPTIDAVVHVPWFLLAGAGEHLATFGFGLFLVPVWWCVLVGLMWATGGGSAANLHAPTGWILAGLMATGSVLFGLPSRSAWLGVRSQQVTSLADHIRSIARDEATIRLLQSGVAGLDSASSTRITRINWLLGICWAGLVWASSRWVFTPEVSDALRHEATTRVLGGFAVFLLFGIGVTSYEASVRMVKQTINFAFLQASDARSPAKG